MVPVVHVPVMEKYAVLAHEVQKVALAYVAQFEAGF
jgi:hypothetical protein